MPCKFPGNSNMSSVVAFVSIKLVCFRSFQQTLQRRLSPEGKPCSVNPSVLFNTMISLTSVLEIQKSGKREVMLRQSRSE